MMTEKKKVPGIDKKRKRQGKSNSAAEPRIRRAIGGVHHDRVAFVEAETVNQFAKQEGVSVNSLVKVKPEAAWCDGVAR